MQVDKEMRNLDGNFKEKMNQLRFLNCSKYLKLNQLSNNQISSQYNGFKKN
jgi:septation ring formation regulator EzrA